MSIIGFGFLGATIGVKSVATRMVFDGNRNIMVGNLSFDNKNHVWYPGLWISWLSTRNREPMLSAYFDFELLKEFGSLVLVVWLMSRADFSILA